MRKLLRLVHVLGGAGFIAVVIAAMLIAAGADELSPTSFAASSHALAVIANYMALPLLLVLLTTGMLLLVGHPTLVTARWVWAKAGMASLALALVLFSLLPAVNAVAAMTRTRSSLMPLEWLQAALQTEWVDWIAVLLLAMIAGVLGIWRPKLRRRAPAATHRTTSPL